MASLSDKAGILIVANLLKYGVGFVLPMLLVRLLSPHDYGTYQQLALVGSFASAILLLGLPTSVFYFHARAEGAAQRMALRVQTMGLLALLGLGGAAVMALGASDIARLLKNLELSTLLPVYAAASGLLIGSESFVAFMIVADRYRMALGFEVGETIVRVALMIVPLVLGFGLHGLVLSLLGFAALRYLMRLGTLYGLRERVGSAWRSRLFAREQLGYSLPLAATSWVSVLTGLLDRAIVAMFFSTVDYAIYTVGALEIPLDVIFQASVADVMRATLPRLIREGNEPEIRRLLSESTRKLALVMLPAFFFLWFFAQTFITTLFTSRYAQSVHVFRIYLLLLPLNAFMLSVVPQAYGQTRTNFRIAAIVAPLHVVLSFVLLRLVGFYGPAISAVLSMYLRSLLFGISNLKLTHSRVRDLLPLSGLARTIMACLAAALLARVLVCPGSSSLSCLVLAGLVFSVCYLAAAVLLGAITAGDRRLLQRAAGRVLLRSHAR